MKIILDGKRFVARCTYQERHEAHRAGFMWSSETKDWSTFDMREAARLRKFFDEDVENLFKRFSVIETPWTGRRSDYEIKGQKLRDYQVRAVEWALSRNHSYIAYRMRLGKTPIGVSIMNAVRGRTLLVVPPNLISVWKKEITKWSMFLKSYKFQIIDGDTYGISKALNTIVILPHSFLPREPLRDLFLKEHFDLCLVDEAHHFKDHGAKSTRHLLGQGHLAPGIVQQCNKVVYLSGSPMPNRPKELHPILYASAQNTIDFLNEYSFGQKFCNGFQQRINGRRIWNFQGASNLEELHEKIKPFMLIKIQGEKKENLREEIILLESGEREELSKMEKNLRKQFTLKQILNRPTLGGIAQYRKGLGLSKVGTAAKHLEFDLELTNDSLLVLAWHRDVILSLANHLSRYGPKVILGGVKNEERQYIQKAFQNEKTKIIIAQISTMEGIDLSRANQVYFVEFDWVPKSNNQAMFRAISETKKSLVSVNYFVAKDSFEKYVLLANKNKKQVINTVIKE